MFWKKFGKSLEFLIQKSVQTLAWWSLKSMLTPKPLLFHTLVFFSVLYIFFHFSTNTRGMVFEQLTPPNICPFVISFEFSTNPCWIFTVVHAFVDPITSACFGLIAYRYLRRFSFPFLNAFRFSIPQILN